MKKKKVILNLNEDVHHRFQELYGHSVGVSAAIRALMEHHLAKLEKQKDQNNEQPNDQDTSEQLAGQLDIEF